MYDTELKHVKTRHYIYIIIIIIIVIIVIIIMF